MHAPESVALGPASSSWATTAATAGGLVSRRPLRQPQSSALPAAPLDATVDHIVVSIGTTDEYDTTTATSSDHSAPLARVVPSAYYHTFHGGGASVPPPVGLPPQSPVATQRLLHTPLLQVVWQRLSVLISLLLLQSLSQFVLESYEGLITTNVVVPLFLTMLVGAGGNAGNQAAVHAITGLATGELKPSYFWQLLRREFLVALVSSSCLFVIGFFRVYLYYTNEEVQPTPVFATVFCVSLSLFIIVLTSVVLGAALPFVLRWMRFDVEHAAPVIQVVMDILGVCIACVVCSQFLPSSLPATAEHAATAPPVPLFTQRGARMSAGHSRSTGRT